MLAVTSLSRDGIYNLCNLLYICGLLQWVSVKVTLCNFWKIISKFSLFWMKCGITLKRCLCHFSSFRGFLPLQRFWTISSRWLMFANVIKLWWIRTLVLTWLSQSADHQVTDDSSLLLLLFRYNSTLEFALYSSPVVIYYATPLIWKGYRRSL